jgi:hypothetical protein
MGSQGSLGKHRNGASKSGANMHGSESDSVGAIAVQRGHERCRLETQLLAAVYDELLRSFASAALWQGSMPSELTDGNRSSDQLGPIGRQVPIDEQSLGGARAQGGASDEWGEVTGGDLCPCVDR